MMKNILYLMLKAFSVLQMFFFFLWLFGHEEKRLDKKAKINFKPYNVTAWTTNDYNTYIV